MIGGEHRKERFSERLSGSQNQPKNRGYLPGTEVKSAGYTPNTLAGNWFEERADAAFYDGKAVLPTENAKLWTTSYREMSKLSDGASADRSPQSPHGSPTAGFDQRTMLEIVDRTHSSYPGHQPHLAPDHGSEEAIARAVQTTSQQTYVPPAVAEAAELSYVKPVLGRTPGAQATGVLLRLRRQLELSQPNKTDFPGNVIRSVRLALAQHAALTGGTDGCVNAQELQAGLTAVGVDVSPPECIALVRLLDTTGAGTVSVKTIADRLRGDINERRVQLMRDVYGLLSSIASARASARPPPTSAAVSSTASGETDGLVRLALLVELIDMAQLPAVASGEVSEADARAAFDAQWGEVEAGSTRRGVAGWDDGVDARRTRMLVSQQAFTEYFSEASFEIPSEGVFERTMRNLWHLSGGSGQCQNTACRRVEVARLNGRVTLEEVRNDLAINGAPQEIDRLIRENLEKQGIKDVKSYRVLGKEEWSPS